MGRIEWTPALSIGLENIDEEHKKLIAICNKLAHNIKGPSNSQVITEEFKDLRAYTVYHFSNEEKYQKTIHYPEANAHAQEHARLRKSVKDFQQSLYKEGYIPQQTVINFLKDWLINHVLREDMKIGQFARSKMTTGTSQELRSQPKENVDPSIVS
ncbi:bacteriohemerythrin [Solidesulfovibrio magneticus]|uniref:Hemerythrin family protein n=1 Tax=Solidesulfovibrio magneticus (strain ATCC 700980 / DSM 13731 / RS-1) TaxID=573370 RepID=C4XPV7_SOLM1|nr:bacteriohemerythrin [Solidesulfovibrio magneticus]BAH77657.1 hemerythrin family protein [Solidesulfovibrio magneticus RS-1]